MEDIAALRRSEGGKIHMGWLKGPMESKEKGGSETVSEYYFSLFWL